MKLKKDDVVKDIKEESLIGDYIAAGWKVYKEVEEKPKKYSDNKKREDEE